MSYIGEMIENAEKGIPLDISNKPGKEYAPELVKNVTDGLKAGKNVREVANELDLPWQTVNRIKQIHMPQLGTPEPKTPKRETMAQKPMKIAEKEPESNPTIGSEVIREVMKLIREFPEAWLTIRFENGMVCAIDLHR